MLPNTTAPGFHKTIFTCLGLTLTISLLSGCGLSPTDHSGVMPGTISGNIHGGQQPVVGAKVYLYAASETGYGTAATSLLTGGPVLTDSGGFFSLTGGYDLAACQAVHSQVYVVSVGGDTGAGTNDKAMLMAALGDCANLSSSTFTWVNEVTSVSAAYALAQFITPGSVNVSTSPTNLTGMRNAFLTVENLVDSTTGVARTTPISPAKGTVPQTKINALANIMAACVNANNASSVCGNLFALATPPGGTAPADSLTAVLNIALNPANNVSTLYNLQTGAAPFQPTLPAKPNDWTVTVQFTGGGLNGPRALAVDAAGNVWVPNVSSNTVSAFSTVGAPLFGASGGTALNGFVNQGFTSIGLDAAGRAWYIGALSSPAKFYGVNADGTAAGMSGTLVGGTGYVQLAVNLAGTIFSPQGGGVAPEGVDYYQPPPVDVTGHITTSPGLLLPTGIAVDGADQTFWVADTGNDKVVHFDASGAELASYGPGTLHVPTGVAVDSRHFLWIVENYFSGSPTAVEVMNSSGTVQNASSGTTVPTASRFVAIDGANTAWTANDNGTISHIASDYTSISDAAKGYQSTGLQHEYGLAIDASGNLWTSDSGGPIVEWVGVAAPVKVPTALNLLPGTRP